MDFNLTTEQQQIRKGRLPRISRCLVARSGQAAASQATIATERMLHAHRLALRGIAVGSLAAVCVFSFVLTGCASPAARGHRTLSPPPSCHKQPSLASPKAALMPRTTARATAIRSATAQPSSNPVPRWLSESFRPDLRRPVDSPLHDAVIAGTRGLGTGSPLRVSGANIHA